MIDIYCNSNSFEYDIRALVMAFFPFDSLGYHILSEADNTGINITLLDNDIFISAGDVKETYHFTYEADRRSYRDELKRCLYRALSVYTGERLAWGTLTGVRPTKIPMMRMLSGDTKETAVEHMKNAYYCSEEKASLCAEVAEKEIGILEKAGFGKGCSIYIGIPFCPTVCNYCSFSSLSLNKVNDADDLMRKYIEAIKKECGYAGSIFKDRPLTGIYIGGGTPTALNEKYLSELMDIIRADFNIKDALEFCVEAGRPDSINEEKLAILKNAGVDRISVNPQTMKDKTLSLIGRRHTAECTRRAFHMARACGFDNINMDIIAGLNGETVDDFKNTLNEIKKLSPESFTVHSLVVKRASEYRKLREESGISHTEGVVSAMLDEASEYAKSNGYNPYYMYRQKNKAGLGEGHVLENVGYAKSGRESVYNVMIMEEKQTIIALGAGAQSKYVKPYNPYSGGNTEIVRNSNVKNVYEYIDRIDEMIERKKRWLDEQTVN